MTAVVSREQLCTAPLQFQGSYYNGSPSVPRLTKLPVKQNHILSAVQLFIAKTLVHRQNPYRGSARKVTEHWLCRWKRLHPVSQLLLLMLSGIVLHIIFVSLI